jgi:hypothetical protein
MKPCECKDMEDVKKLQESGLYFNSEGIVVTPNYVTIDVGVAQLKLSMRRFEQFARWYLEDQKNENL